MRPTPSCNSSLPTDDLWIRPWTDRAAGSPVHPPPIADGPSEDGGLPLHFVARRWADPIVEEHGFPVHSAYVETVLLPILGPSTTLCLRRLGAWVAAVPAGVTVDLSELAHDLGLGNGVGRHSPIVRTVDRLCRFGMSAWEGRDLAVRTAVAPVTERQLVRLTPRIVGAHRAMVASLGSPRR